MYNKLCNFFQIATEKESTKDSLLIWIILFKYKFSSSKTYNAMQF
jgi:hypothetical protein